MWVYFSTTNKQRFPFRSKHHIRNFQTVLYTKSEQEVPAAVWRRCQYARRWTPPSWVRVPERTDFLGIFLILEFWTWNCFIFWRSWRSVLISLVTWETPRNVDTLVVWIIWCFDRLGPSKNHSELWSYGFQHYSQNSTRLKNSWAHSLCPKDSQNSLLERKLIERVKHPSIGHFMSLCRRGEA